MRVYGHEYILKTEVEYRLERAGVGRGNPGLGGSGAWAGIRSGFLARRREHQTAAAAGAAAAAAPASPLASADLRHGRRQRGAARLVATLVVGLSHGWWMRKHSRHHANPN